VGTTFNVYRRGNATRVAVVEGKVQLAPRQLVKPAITAIPTATLVGAQTTHIDSSGAIDGIQSIEPQKITAWTQPRLLFDEEPLQRVVAEFNRYNVTQLAVDDPELAQYRINGVFDADDPRALVAYLQRIHHVDVRETAPNLEILTWEK